MRSQGTDRYFCAAHSLINGVKQNLRELFLPVGYPEGLHTCYQKFHLWLGVETFLGSMISVLCSQAMLGSLGLGAAEAAGGAVAIQWVLKDGIGEVGKLFFIKRYASSFDSHPKTWKIVGEGMSSVGSFLQLCTCVVSVNLFLPLAAVGNMLESIHRSVWFASHMTFTKHFSPHGNIGDIVAKDDAQTSTAQLLGMLSGVSLLTLSHSQLFLFGCFSVLAPIHLWSTTSMLKAAKFENLNQANLILLGQSFVDNGKVMDYEQLHQSESLGYGGEWIQQNHKHVNIKMGLSADKAYQSANEIRSAIGIFKNETYLLNYRENTVNILFHNDAQVNDVIKAVLHAIKFYDALITSKQDTWKTLDQTLHWTTSNCQPFLESLKAHQWQCDNVYWNDGGIRLTWDRQITCSS
ncbi:vitamin B6 photo-protection and homoeostasis-domain-containing protein [Absidia repens]|uniref:Vitamin B6 photo-protection and homoeostasis-domain-containing protein n=1 Tax=Absidia repens TaxID=90262 RepID=A0A1X2I7C3_9FUNG|nr:vitamin B6 photo-protection and homoeostasis-domain-containing protein [Absidia repens]